MKKLTSLFVFITISVFLFAQGVIQIPPAQKAVKISDLSVANQNSLNQLKSTKGSKAIDFFCDFNSGEIGTFTIVNVDGNTQHADVPLDFSSGWISIYYVSDPSNVFAASMSIFDPPGQADQWLITPVITIGSGSILVWEVQSGGLTAGSAGEAYEVLISTTGGSGPLDFTDPPVFTTLSEVPTNEWNQHIIELELAGYSNTDIYIAFRNVTNAGQMILIDNIKVETPPANEIVLEKIHPVFYGVGFYSQTPKTQVMDVFFGAKVFNFGLNTQTNIYLNVDVNDGISSVYNETSNLLTILSLDPLILDTIGIDDTTPFSPPAGEIMDYTAVFTISSDSIDDNPSNNIDSISFSISDSVLARDRIYSSYTSPSLYVGAVDGDLVGVDFYVMNDDTVSSISVYIDPSTTVNTSIVARLYQYDAAWVEIAASNLYDITGSDLGEWVTLLFSTEIPITGDYWYCAGIEFYWDGIGDLYIGQDGTRPDIHDYTNSVSLRLDGTWYYTEDGIPMIHLNFKVDMTCYLTDSITAYTNVSCYGGNDGSATVIPLNGTTPYNYLWDDASSQTTATAINLTPGTYNVTVTDGHLCTATASVTITEPPTYVSMTYTVDTVTIFGGQDGAIDISPTGGTTPYNYNWTGPDAFTSTNQNITNLFYGWYYLTVTDFNSCTLTQSIYVPQPNDSTCILAVTISNITNVSCYGGEFFGYNGSATVTVTAGIPPYTFLWNDASSQTTATANNLTPGTYTIAITDDSSCVEIATAVITEPDAIVIDYTTVGESYAGANDGEIDITVSGGTPGYQYTWSTTETTEDISGLGTGTYTVTVRDWNGCEETGTIILDYACILDVNITDSTMVSVVGGNDGSATVTATGGNLPYTYLWSNGQTTQTAINLSAGTYSVTVTDQSTPVCIGSDSVEITEPSFVYEPGNDDIISIYPNPSKGKLYIKNAENATIYIYNIIGEELISFDNSKKSELYTIDISAFAEGAYIIRIVNKKSVITKKINLIK